MTRFAGLSINGRFLAARPTGVHRVARELIGHLGRHHEELTGLFGACPTVLAPRNVAPDAITPGLPLRCSSLLAGHAWEQMELPLRARGTLLLSFCNLAPVLHGASVPMFHDAQTFSTPQSYSPAFRAFYRLMQPIMGARALRVLTVSEFSRGQLAHYGVADAGKIRVIHNGVNHGQSHTPDGTILALPDGAILARLGLRAHGYVLALASTQAHKNIDVLLKAFGESGNGPQLVLFGAAGPQDFTKAGLTVPESVVFAGRVSDSELAALMASALCFAMPSLTEGFGLPPLEAMALGCPAVVAPCGALPEVCGTAALYAEPDSPEQWRAAIASLAADPALRAHMLISGRDHAAEMSWERAGNALMDVLREIAAGRSMAQAGELPAPSAASVS